MDGGQIRDGQMDDGERLPVTPLGQSGYRFGFGDCVVYVDPYLSDSVERLEGEDHRRLTPAPAAPGAVSDARVCCITHIHQDHADPDTLIPLAKASAHCRFVCPNEVAKALWAWGIDRDRVVIADREPMRLSDALAVTPVPAAHEDLDVDEEGRYRYLGYVFEWRGRRFYHAGDTSPHEHLLAVLRGLGPIDVAFLPVNERSFFRKRRGIIGNMSVREAFAMAAEIGVRTLVPMHWDMFAPNSVFREEIELVYGRLNPSFALSIHPMAV
jgi:L-ascorbate metabolism protein UlaG (beta-lactamase superfamily)